MRANRTGRSSELGQAIEKYLRQKGFVRMSRESLVPVVWAEVVGEWYCRHTEVTRLDKGVLTITCDSAARAQQLQLDSPRIIEAINARVGGSAVKEIRPSSGGIRWETSRFVGEPAEQRQLPTPQALRQIDLPDSEREWARAAATSIEDEELRRQFEGLLIRECKLAHWKLAQGYVPCARCGALIRPGGKLCKTCDPGRIPQQGSTDVLPDPWWV